MISIPPGVRVYAIGDVHGRSDLLDRLFAEIGEDVERSPAERIVELFIGDYVDRGPDSAGVIERAMTPHDGRERVCLMGNHEDAMIAAMQHGSQMDRWLAIGGEATLRAYGIDVAEYLHDPQALQPLLHSVVPRQHVEFLDRLEVSHRIGGTLFVHAGIRPGVPIEDQERHDMIWIRDEFLDHAGPFPLHVVHGHTPVSVPEARRWRTNIDTGAVYGGALSAAVLEGSAVRFLSVAAGER